MLFSPFSDEMVSLLSQPRVTAAVAVRIQFGSGPVCVHSGTGALVIDGHVYQGVGSLGRLDEVKESPTTSPTQVKMTLSGLDMSLLSSTLNEQCVGRTAEILVVAFDNDTLAVRACNLLFKGRVSSTGAKAGKDSSLQYTVSNVFEDWQRPWPERYTDESHQMRYPGDRIFRYVAQMSERSIYWGNKKDAPGFTYS